MELAAILAAIEASCDGKEGSDDVQVPAELLLAAQQELKGKAQMARDLEMARDEASMKPSVARKLNEKIRGLESELEELRSNKKVKELEKKVQFLEHELKQSYTTKNFTLKSGLLELEKQYRPHMNVDPAMAAFWDDITVLLDEKKDRDTLQPKGPRMTGPSAVSDTRSSRPPSSSGSAPPAAAAGAAEQPAGGAAQPRSPRKDAPASASTAAAAAPKEGAGEGLEQSSGSSTAVQAQVTTFNTIISEEAASAASLPADLNSGRQESGDMVVRHGAGFRVVRAAGTKDPLADVTAADSSSSASAGAAAAAGSGSGAQQEQQQQQQVALLRQEFAERAKDVTFHTMPASKQQAAATSADAPVAVQQPIPAEALEQQSDAVTSSLQDLVQQFGSLAAASTKLPQPPALVGSAADQQQQQLAGEVDTASLWQHQLQQLLESAQQLKQQVAAGSQSAETLRQQAATADGLVESVCRMLTGLQSVRSSDPDEKAAVSDAQQKLSELKQELQQLQHSLQRLAAEAGGQRMLVSVFGEFLSQLQEQGVIAPEAAAAAASDASSQEQQEAQPAMLTLLQSFLHANPQVPQMLAVQLAPAAPPAQQQEEEVPALPAVELSSTAVQAVADAEHREVQAVAEAEHQEVQATADAEHREVQCEPADSQHAGTQSDLLTRPSDHMETQTETAADHAGTQTESLQPSTSHVSTQAAAEAVSAEVQTTPPSPVAAAVQAELRPEVSEAGSQADLPALAAPTAETGAGSAPSSSTGGAGAPAEGAGRQPPDSPSLGESTRHGSGIIYSGSGSELSVGKAAVGQQLDILHRIERSRAGDAPGEGDAAAAAAAVVEVKPEQLTDLEAVAKELGQLRADNVELAANLQVTQSLVDHLNTNLKAAIDKADDAETEAVQAKQQLEKTAASLAQLQSEHAEVTHVLIDAKVEIAEKKGELLKLVRDMKRTIAEQRANPATNAAGVVKELENIHDKILAVVPSAADDADVHSPAHAASRQGSSFDNARGGFAGLAAGALGQLGHMREAIAGGLGSARGARPAARVSDSSGAQGAEGLTPTQSGTATLGSSGSEQVEKQ